MEDNELACLLSTAVPPGGAVDEDGRRDLAEVRERGRVLALRRKVGTSVGALVALAGIMLGAVHLVDDADRGVTTADAPIAGWINGERTTRQGKVVSIRPGTDSDSVEIRFEGRRLLGSASEAAAPGWRDEPVSRPNSDLAITGASLTATGRAEADSGVLVATVHVNNPDIRDVQMRRVDGTETDQSPVAGSGVIVLAIELVGDNWADSTMPFNLEWTDDQGSHEFHFRPRLVLDPCDSQTSPDRALGAPSTVPLSLAGAVPPPVIPVDGEC